MHLIFWNEQTLSVEGKFPLKADKKLFIATGQIARKTWNSKGTEFLKK